MKRGISIAVAALVAISGASWAQSRFSIRLKNNGQTNILVEYRRVEGEICTNRITATNSRVVEPGGTIDLLCNGVSDASYCILTGPIELGGTEKALSQLNCSNPPPSGLLELNLFGR